MSIPLQPLPPETIPFGGPGSPGVTPPSTALPGNYRQPTSHSVPGEAPTVTIPAVEAVAGVTMSPFVRGAMLGLLVGAAGVGVAWWVKSK